MDFMSKNCHICAGATLPLLTKDGYPLAMCDVCGLVCMSPLPEPKFLATEVYSYESGYQSNKAKDLSTVAVPQKTRDILEFLKKNMDRGGASAGKILDVGCSSGEFLYAAKQAGFDVQGVELNHRTAQIAVANGIPVHVGVLEANTFASESFDVIFLGDVIEHVLDPREFVQLCRLLLKKDGLIVISTPNLDCVWAKTTFAMWRLFGIPWSSVTPPYHTYQFGTGNLAMLMGQEGFGARAAWYYRPPRLMYELGSLHLVKRVKQARANRQLLRTVLTALYTIFAFALYTVLYGIIVNTRLLRKKDFSMIQVFEK